MIEFLSITPEIDGWMFIGFTILSSITAAFGVIAGLGGGVLMIGVMAMVFPPVALIPVHGVIQAGTNLTRVIIMRRLILKQMILPFALGSILGATVGGIFRARRKNCYSGHKLSKKRRVKTANGRRAKRAE